MENCAIYRFNFSEEVNDAIAQFAQVHKFDDRTTYKENWSEWSETNNDLIEKEARRLDELGYKGNIDEKMFKAGRYYFRTKDKSKKEPATRKSYISMSKNIITLMDQDIETNMSNNDFTPANGYITFCETYQELINQEFEIMTNKTSLSNKDFLSKIKKTYKNRHFIISRKYRELIIKSKCI